jgi:type I restriction enzyme S subunit
MVGKIIKIPEKISGSLLNQNAVRLRLKDQGKFNLIYYQLKTKRYVDYIKKIFRGNANQASITLEDLFNFIIIFPQNNKESDKIAEILSTWDKAIELKEKLIDEKKKFRIAIVADLLFGLKRFDEFIKSHKYNSTKYTNIPEDWEFIKIGEIATEVSEKNGNNDELPVLSCTKHSGLVDSLTYFKKRVFSKDTSTYKQVKKNQFVYATNHIDEGSIGCQNIYDNSLVSPMYTVFKTNSKVNNDFLFSLLKTRLYIFIYQVNMSASVDRRGSLRWNEFSKIRIPLPDIAEQNKIVEFIRSVDNEIELLKLELNQFKEQKRGLMQLLLTGIIRVEVD